MKKIGFLSMVIAITCFGIIWGTRPIQSQTLVTFPPFVATPEYNQALQIVQLITHRDEGVQKLRDIANRNPRTSLGAQCLFAAAYWGEDLGSARLIYGQISNQYANSRFDLAARLALLNTEVALTKETWPIKLEQLVRQFGAPGVNIIVADRQSAVQQLKQLPQEYQDGMMGIYYQLAQSLGEVRDYRRAVAVAALGAESYADDVTARAKYRGLVRTLTAAPSGGIKNYDTVTTNPIVRILSPQKNQITGPRPSIGIKSWTGDYTHAQVSLTDSQFLLDGQDVKAQLLTHSQFSKVWKQGPKRVWEKATWVFRPSLPLTPGRHTVTVVVRVGGYLANHKTGTGETSVSWTFQVSQHQHDDDHDCLRDEDPEDDD